MNALTGEKSFSTGAPMLLKRPRETRVTSTNVSVVLRDIVVRRLTVPDRYEVSRGATTRGALFTDVGTTRLERDGGRMIQLAVVPSDFAKDERLRQTRPAYAELRDLCAPIIAIQKIEISTAQGWLGFAPGAAKRCVAAPSRAVRVEP